MQNPPNPLAEGPARELCGIVLHPAAHTLSPVLHGAAYAALGLNAVYLTFNVAPYALEGAVTMMKTAVQDLVEGLDLDTSRTIFVPALSSGETVASKSGRIPVLARQCAEAVGASFVRDAIKKQAHEPIHDVRGAGGRRAVLDKAGYAADGIAARNILVFDDFITRGDTLSHIAQAILMSNPRATVYGVALGKTERRDYHRIRFGIEISNDHVPHKWNTLWVQGEQRYQKRRGRSKS